MLRFLARTFGLWLLAGALIALVVDGARAIASTEIVATPLIAVWRYVSPGSLEAARAAVEDAAPAWLWDPVLVSLLQLPAFAVFVAAGALLLWAGQKRRPVLGEPRLG